MKKTIAFILAAVAFSAQAYDLRGFPEEQDKLHQVASKTVEFYYNHQFAPSWLSEDDAVAALQRAAKSWESCGVTLDFKGVTMTPAESRDGKTVFGWHWVFDDAAGRTELRTFDDKIVEADVQLNRRKHFNIQQTEASFLREMGKALGVLEPSSSPKSVMWKAAEFESRTQTKLFPEDIAQCKKANSALFAQK